MTDYSGYYLTTYADLDLGRGLLSRAPLYTFQGNGSLLASLSFKDGHSKAEWDKTATPVAADDPRVATSLVSFPAMRLA